MPVKPGSPQDVRRAVEKSAELTRGIPAVPNLGVEVHRGGRRACRLEEERAKRLHGSPGGENAGTDDVEESAPKGLKCWLE